MDRKAELESRCAAHSAWVDGFRGRNGWAVIPADVECPCPFSNAERSELEALRFLARESDVWTVYHVEASNTVQTFNGEVLGVVLSARKHRGGFGARMCSVRFKGIDGRVWAGRYGYESRQCVNVRVVKGGA